jgi:hypothetical protein
MRRHLPLLTACTSLFRAGACAARFGASKNIICTNRWETCSRSLGFSAHPFRANCSRPISAQQQSRVLSSFHSRSFASNNSSNSNDGEASSTRTVFEPALTIPRFLRAFAIAQAAVCFVNGAVLVVLHNPLTGGSLRLVRSAFAFSSFPIVNAPFESSSERPGLACVSSYLVRSRCGLYPPMSRAT